MPLRTLTLCILLALGACSKPAEPVPAAPVAPAGATAVASAAAVAEAPAVVPASAVPAVAATGTLQASDYETIENGQPYAATSGKIEVVEFFNYACPACDAFEPLMQAWKAQLPDDVHVVYVPADFRPDFAVYARAYYAADLLGIAAKTHAAVYEAIHTTHTLPGEGAPPEASVLAGFYAKYGVTSQAFVDAMNSFAVNTRMSQGRQYMIQSKLNSTPSMLVNGRYMAKGRSFEDKLRITGLLIERERSRGAAGQ